MKKYVENYNKTQYEDITMNFNSVRTVEARYIKQTEPMDIGNDLIEALVPLKSEIESFEQFEYRPYYSVHERNLTAEKRCLAIMRLDSYRIGRDYTHIIDREIQVALRRCYRARKKFNLDKIQTLDETGRYFTDCEYVKIEGQKTQGFSLIGISGGGKTTSLSSSLYNYPQVIYHTDENSRCIQVVYIKVECPPDGSIKSFYNACIDALQEATGIPIAINSTKTTADKERLFKRLALRWNLGMIVIEEIQQLSLKREETMNQFLTLANDTQIPIVYVGTFKAMRRIFGIDFRLARRLGNEIIVKRYNKDMLWNDMLEELWQFQWLKEYVPLTPELNDVLYEETAGIIDRVITLFEVMQLDAIMNEQDNIKSITPTYVRNISAKYFSTTRSVLRDLSRGKTEDIIGWDDIFDRMTDKKTVQYIANELERRRASAIILDSERRKEIITIDGLRNNIITNILATFGQAYSVKEIETAFNFLNKKYKLSLIEMEESKVNNMIVRLLINPENMDKSSDKKKELDFELPILENFL